MARLALFWGRRQTAFTGIIFISTQRVIGRAAIAARSLPADFGRRSDTDAVHVQLTFLRAQGD